MIQVTKTKYNNNILSLSGHRWSIVKGIKPSMVHFLHWKFVKILYIGFMVLLIIYGTEKFACWLLGVLSLDLANQVLACFNGMELGNFKTVYTKIKMTKA